MPRLTVNLIKCVNLPHKSFGRSPDPVVEITVAGQRQKSTIKHSTINPIWNETFTFNINNPQCDVVQLHLFDYETFGDNILMGRVDVKISDLVMGQITQRELVLQGLKRGSMFISLKAEDFGIGSQPQPQINPMNQSFTRQPSQIPQPIMAQPNMYPPMYPQQPQGFQAYPPQPPMGYPQPYMQPYGQIPPPPQIYASPQQLPQYLPQTHGPLYGSQVNINAPPINGGIPPQQSYSSQSMEMPQQYGSSVAPSAPPMQ
jgi:hypothetical protein